MDIKYIQNLLSSLKDDYIAEAKGEKPSKRWLQDFNEEIREIQSYRGREILELLQNADDAQSDCVDIYLDTRFVAGFSMTTPSNIQCLKSYLKSFCNL